MRSMILALAIGAIFTGAALALATDPTVVGGVPQPSAQPTCAAKKAGFYADANGCVYACSDQRQGIVARPLNASCVFPSTTATP